MPTQWISCTFLWAQYGARLRLAEQSQQEHERQQGPQRMFVLEIMRPGARSSTAVACCQIDFDSRDRMRFAKVVFQSRRFVSYSRTVVLGDAAAEACALKAFIGDPERVGSSRGLKDTELCNGSWRLVCGFKLVLRCRSDGSEIATKVCRRRSFAALRRDLAAMVGFARSLRCV